jgi:polar amino acid transport system substrate-binding protein
MFKDRFGALTNRRALFRRGAVVSAAAAAAGIGLSTRRAMAVDSYDDSRLKQILDRGKVIVGTGATNPPWHFEDDNGQTIGMDIDMAKILAAGIFGLDLKDNLNDEVVRPYLELVIQEANQRIPNLLADKIDVNFQFMTVTNLRAVQVEFTYPYYVEAATFLLPADSEFNSVADMQGKGVTVSALQNVGVEEDIHAAIPDATVEQLASIADAITAMDAGRSDAALVDLSSGKWFAANTPGKYKFTPESINPNSYAASVKPGDQIWLNYVNTVIHEACVGYHFPAYREAFKRWFGEDLPPLIAGFPSQWKQQA